MTTDNRTNEPTDEQVEAAAKAIWDIDDSQVLDPPWDQLDEKFKRHYRTLARAALVAAAGAATDELDKVTLGRLQELAEKRGYDKGFAAGWKSGGKTADLLVPKLRKAQAERDAALARIAEAAELHQPEVIGVHEGQGAEVWCPHCETYWPCQTAVALGLNEGENDD